MTKNEQTVSYPILESTTRTGKKKYWQGHLLRKGDRWYTQVTYWQSTNDGGTSAMQTSEPYEALPKNVGRANETTAKKQAQLEMESVIKKQKDKGYHEAGTELDSRPLPMLAQKFSERGDKLEFPIHVQPKLNGMRMLFDGEVGWSRGNKNIIPEVIEHLKVDTDGLILDGELILPGNKLLQETMRAAKKFRVGVSDKLLYVVYDVIEPNLSFEKRWHLLEEWVTRMGDDIPSNIQLCTTVRVTDPDEVAGFHKIFVESGYEGTMCRDNSDGYDVGHRSNQLQKLKDFTDAEYKIVDVLEGDGSFKGCAIFVCETPEGRRFNCTPEGTMEYRKELYNTRDRHLDKYLTVRYFELSRDLIPIFPIGENIRDKDDF